MKYFLRLLTIQRVLFRYRLDKMVFASPMLRVFRLLLLLLPVNWRLPEAQQRPVAVRFRCALEALGPIFVKCGQLLSTRRDLLSRELFEELSGLQNRVPPFSGALAREIIEHAYGRPLDTVFRDFDEAPLASASIAQVHAATLLDGRCCIVKVVRPGIRAVIRRDMALIGFLARQMEKYHPQSRALHVTGVVRELEKTLFNELDIKREAANASQLRRNFQDEPRYCVPEVYWRLVRDNVLVMERISGIPVSDIEALKRAGVDLAWLADFITRIFLTQVFRDNYFHADMHPGNIFVQPGENGHAGSVAVVDFGVMSSLTEFDKRYLAGNFVAFLDHDYQRVATLHLESGWVPSDTRVDELEFAIRTVCEPLLDRPVREISFSELLRRLFGIARSFHVEIMPQLLLLQKTMVYVEGIGRQLHPEMDIWQVARPQLEQWMRQRTRVKGLFKHAANHFPHWAERMPQFPVRIMDLVERLQDGKVEMVFKSDDVRRIRRELRFYCQRAIHALIGSALLLCALVSYAIANGDFAVSGARLLSFLSAVLGIVFLVSALKKSGGSE